MQTNQAMLDLFWRFVHERQEIWHRRVVLHQPGPWAQSGDPMLDQILDTYKFTNIVRDLDYGTIFYIDTILRSGHDARNIIFNTMLYRLFNRPETYAAHGFIDLNHWTRDFEALKSILRQRKSQGMSLATSAHQTPSGVQYNPDIKTCHIQMENFFCVLERWHDEVDTIHQRVTQSPDLTSLKNYLMTLPAIGRFLSYEMICDWTLAPYYAGFTLVQFDEDSDVSVGPGSSKGVDLIFTSLGQQTRRDAIIHLRQSMDAEMQRLGLNFKYPDPRRLFSLRSCEHALCEFQKFYAAYTGTGRPRNKFKVIHQPTLLKP